MAGVNVLYDEPDLIEIDQGSSFVATFAIFDDIEFRQVVTDKLESIPDLDDRIKYPLIHLVNNTGLTRSDLYLVASNVMAVGGVDEAIISDVTTTLMSETRTISLAGKQLSFYVAIYKGSRAYKFQAEASVVDEENGLVRFNIPPEVTQEMVKVKRPYEEVEGIFTIEILNTYNGEIHRINQGKVRVNRGAK